MLKNANINLRCLCMVLMLFLAACGTVQMESRVVDEGIGNPGKVFFVRPADT